MWIGLKVTALAASAVWTSLFVVVLILTGGTLGDTNGSDLVAVLTPLGVTFAAVWIGFYGTRVSSWLAMTIELSLLGAGTFGWLIVAAASGG